MFSILESAVTNEVLTSSTELMPECLTGSWHPDIRPRGPKVHPTSKFSRRGRSLPKHQEARMDFSPVQFLCNAINNDRRVTMSYNCDWTMLIENGNMQQ